MIVSLLSHWSGKQAHTEPTYLWWKPRTAGTAFSLPLLLGNVTSVLWVVWGWQGHAPVPDPCKKAVLHPGWCMPLPPASQVQSCPASDCATSPALVNWSLEDRQGEKMCFYSCHTCKTAVTRGYAGSMGFSFGLKGEISVQSGDLLQGISCRALAANPAANGAAAARRLLSPRVQSGKLALNEQRKTCLATIWPFASLYHAPHNNSSSCNQPPSVRT